VWSGGKAGDVYVKGLPIAIIMKVCISYQTVILMTMYPVQEAAKLAVERATEMLKNRYKRAGDISIVCVNKLGQYSAATNTNEFSYVVMGDCLKPTVHIITKDTKAYDKHPEADDKWMADYYNARHKDI
jgi:N4-(beta-N-acetylglucosaminyl)-L-asparaginase